MRAATTEELSFRGGMSKDSSHAEWYAPLMQDFVSRVRARDTTSAPLEEALYVTRVISRAYESSDQGRALPLASGGRAPSPVAWPLAAVTEAVSKVVEPTEAEAAEPPAIEAARRAPWAARFAGLAVLAGASMWVLQGIGWRELLAATSRVSPLWVALATAVNLGAVYVMAGRWRALLHSVAPLVRARDAFKAMVVGFAVSIVVPARAGELARAEWLARRTGLPRATVLGSIVLDHLVNGAGLLCGIAVLPALLELPRWLHSAIWLAVVVFAVAGSGVFLPRVNFLSVMARFKGIYEGFTGALGLGA